LVSPIFFLALFGVGIVAKVPPFDHRPEVPRGVDYDGEVAPWVDSWWPPTVARNHYARVLTFAWNFPKACVPGHEVNDFQITECAQFRDRFTWAAALCFMPLAFLLMALIGGGGKIGQMYRRGAHALGGQPVGQGVITDPPEAGTDLFSWLYCLQGVSVHLANGRQVVVFIPPEAPMPLPGQKFMIFDLGRHFGKPRYVGALHAPHLAVVAGSR
jgi:hypothetical protein